MVGGDGVDVGGGGGGGVGVVVVGVVVVGVGVGAVVVGGDSGIGVESWEGKRLMLEAGMCFGRRTRTTVAAPLGEAYVSVVVSAVVGRGRRGWWW